jgi:hypothetical protein
LAQQASGSALGKRDPVTANTAIISFFMIGSPSALPRWSSPWHVPRTIRASCDALPACPVVRIHRSPAAQRALARITTIQHVSLITD